MAGWALAIDFGTTNTAAAVLPAGAAEPELVPFDPGDGGDPVPSMPSAVLLDDDGRIVVGHAAERAIAATPERGQRTPKAKLRGGHVVERLGDQSVPVVALVEAVLAAAYRRACEVMDGEPDAVALTCPVAWAPEGKPWRALRAAANLAGIQNPLVVPEPEAAAQHVGLTVRPIEEGGTCAVYDLGGGTCDIAVLRRAGDRLQPLAMSEDEVGGELFDDRLYTDVLAGLDADAAERLEQVAWEQPASPEAIAEMIRWRACQASLARNVRAAKEALSGRDQAHVLVPAPVDRELVVGRERLEALIRADVDRTVGQLRACVERAPDGTPASVYIVGASSRMPAIAATIEAQLDRPAVLPDEPKGAIALGAARMLSRRAAAQPPAWLPPPPPGPPPRRPSAPHLTADGPPLLTGVRAAARHEDELVVLRSAGAGSAEVARLRIADGGVTARTGLPDGAFDRIAVGAAGVAVSGPGRVLVLDGALEVVAQRDEPVFARVGREVAWIGYLGEGERAASRVSRRIMRPLRLRTLALGATPHVVEDLHLGEIVMTPTLMASLTAMTNLTPGEPPAVNVAGTGGHDDGVLVQVHRRRAGRLAVAWSQDCYLADARGGLEVLRRLDAGPWVLAQHRIPDGLVSLTGRDGGQDVTADSGRAPAVVDLDGRELYRFDDARLELSAHAVAGCVHLLVRNPQPPASGGGWCELFACDASGCRRVHREETPAARFVAGDARTGWWQTIGQGDGRSIGLRIAAGGEPERVLFEPGARIAPLVDCGGRLLALRDADGGTQDLVTYLWRSS